MMTRKERIENETILRLRTKIGKPFEELDYVCERDNISYGLKFKLLWCRAMIKGALIVIIECFKIKFKF